MRRAGEPRGAPVAAVAARAQRRHTPRLRADDQTSDQHDHHAHRDHRAHRAHRAPPPPAAPPATTPRSSAPPEALTRLLRFVRAQLYEIGFVDPQGHPVPQPATPRAVRDRLEVYRAAFDLFIGCFGAFAPLLLAIKQAYEDALRVEAGSAAAHDELHARLATYQDESRGLLSSLRADSEAERTRLEAAAALREAELARERRLAKVADLELKRCRRGLEEARALATSLEAKCLTLGATAERLQADLRERDREMRRLTDELRTARGMESAVLAAEPGESRVSPAAHLLGAQQPKRLVHANTSASLLRLGAHA